jgi:hypothetical protein
MTEPANRNLQTAIQTGQLVVLVIAVAGLFATIGRRDAVIDSNAGEIRELRGISADLVKTSIEATTTNREQDRRLDDLRDRLARMENPR